jgi:hypothetical protein
MKLVKSIIFLLIALILINCNKSLSKYSSNEDQVFDCQSLLTTDSLPFGKKELLTNFPDEWHQDENYYENIFNTIYFHLQSIFDVYKSPDRFNNNPFYRLDGDIVAKLPNIDKNCVLIVAKDNSNPSEINNWADLVIINHLNEINKLRVYTYIEKSYITSQTLFYIDNNYIIHIKTFSGDELTNKFLSYKKYKISKKGQFIEIDK